MNLLTPPKNRFRRNRDGYQPLTFEQPDEHPSFKSLISGVS